MKIIKHSEQLELFYNQIDEADANYLKSKELEIIKIGNSYLTDLGRIFKEAQDKYSQNGYGIFGKWIEALGIERTTVSRIIGRYDLIVANCNNQNLIESLPKSLTYEISKPSANPELKERVLNGEIDTLKQYKIELDRLKAENEQLRNRPKEVKEVPVEVSSQSDRNLINNLQRQLNSKEAEINRYESEIERLKKYEASAIEIQEAQKQLQQLRLEHTEFNKRLNDGKEMLSFIDTYKMFMESEMFKIVAFIDSNSIHENTKSELKNLVDLTQDWINNVIHKYNLR